MIAIVTTATLETVATPPATILHLELLIVRFTDCSCLNEPL